MTVDSGQGKSGEIACAAELRRFGHFMEGFSEKLKIAEGPLGISHSDEHSDLALIDYVSESVPVELASVPQLLRSGNDIIDKTFTVFAALCLQIDQLKSEARTRFYNALLLYGDLDVDSTLQQDGGALRMMGHFLPCLQELSVFVQRCYEVCRNLVHQLAALHNNRNVQFLKLKDVRVDHLCLKLGELLTVLIVLDEIVKKHPSLLDHWSRYMKAVQIARHNPSRFNVDTGKLKPVENMLARLDNQLMSGYIFQNCVEQPFDTQTGVTVCTNSVLNDKLVSTMKELCVQWDKKTENAGEELQAPDKHMLMSILALLALNYYIFKSVDKKLLRQIWDMYKKLPAFHLVGNLIWTPCEFLATAIPGLLQVVDKKGLSAVTSYRSFLFQQQAQMLTKEAQTHILTISDWCNEMQKSLTQWPKQHVSSELETRTKLFKTIRTAEVICRLLRTVLNGHLLEKHTLPKSSALALFRLVEVLKCLEWTFARNWLRVRETCNHACQQLTGRLLAIVSSGKDKLRTEKGYSEERIDLLAAVLILEQTLTGPATSERLTIVRLALDAINYSKIYRSSDVLEIDRLLHDLSLVGNIGVVLREAVDCGFLYWHKNLFPLYFESLLSGKENVHRITHFFNGVSDCVRVVRMAAHMDASFACSKFEDTVYHDLEQYFLSKVADAMENDLRLSIHTHLQLNDRNPFSTNPEPTLDLLSLINTPTVRLNHKCIDLKRYVECRLERTFYDLTTVALHDCKTYAEMRQLAMHKYGLLLAEPHLPSQTLEQGLDVLIIMRNIHVFVAAYNYNLNTQCFIQKESRSRHLNTLNARHVANSIRTHGTGIMNTTVNYTYQFLRRKFHIFSQFLYDDHIKSQLIRDIRYFRENLEALDRMYPMERAEKFNKGVRRLGVNGQGLTYLDQFRILITHIGNALGYVRLVRTGGLEACAQAMHFIPDLEDIVPLAPLVEQANLSPVSQIAAQTFDNTVADLIVQFSEGTQYFKKLVEVFVPEFRNFEKNPHLRNFYAIIPALTINYVDHIMACKERIGKKSPHGEIAFTDDGLCMGIAYILKLMDQHEDFDSLHWFQSVGTRCQMEKEQTQKQHKYGSAGVGKDEKLVQTLALKSKRLQMYKKEFDLVEYGLRSARIFFRTDAINEIIPTKDKDGINAEFNESLSVVVQQSTGSATATVARSAGQAHKPKKRALEKSFVVHINMTRDEKKLR